MKPLIIVLLALWLACVLVLGATGRFVTPPGAAPLPIGLGVVAPLLAFLAAFRGSASFRTLVRTADLPLLTALQAWRFAGFGFLSLYAYGVLPGDFIWSAGLGDIAIGLTAPWVALALVRRPGFAGSRLFIVWNLLGCWIWSRR